MTKAKEHPAPPSVCTEGGVSVWYCPTCGNETRNETRNERRDERRDERAMSYPNPRPEIARRVRATSVHVVARELGIARELPVREATLALARERLAELTRGGTGNDNEGEEP